MRSGRARSERIMERVKGLGRGSFKNIVAGWGRRQKVVDDRDG